MITTRTMKSLLVFNLVISLLSAGSAESVIAMRKPTKKRDMYVFHNICLTDRGGKLEDWMFQYASLHGLARNKRMTAKFDRKIFNKLKKIFKFPLKLVDIVDAKTCEQYEVIVDKRHCTFDRGFVNWILGTDPIVLHRAHLQSWFYFYNSIRKIREEFTFVDSLADEAKQVLNAGLQHAIDNNHIQRGKTPTFIGLIVNRVQSEMDYNGKDAIVPSAAYYRKAMNFFEGNYVNIIYVVYSTDITWAKSNLKGGPFVFVESDVDELVLAIMGSCKHMIISPGAFSFWAAYIADGETIYYKRADDTTDTQHYSYHKMDYYLPYWRPME